MSFAGPTVPFTILLLFVLFCASSPCHGGEAPTHSITAILAASPDFGDFSAALAAANLTGEIDGNHTITVLAVDNAAVGRLRARGLPAESLGHVLSLHVLLDYYDGAKLKAMNSTSHTQGASLYQASGAAPGSAGMVSIAKGSDGRVSFLADAASAVFYQKSVKESPYDIAVLQVSDAISSPAAEGKAPEPSPAPSDGRAPQPSPSPVAATTPAPVGAPPPTNHTAPPPKQAGTPAPSPKPAGKPASPPKPADTPADAPGADDQPPADDECRHKNAAAGTAPWMVGVVVAAAVTAVVFLL